MDSALFREAMKKFFGGLLGVGLLLFLPAWDLRWWQGWLLMGILFVPMFAAGLVMMKKNPALLRRRLKAKEKQGEQKTVILLSGLMFLASFVAAGLSWRLHWLQLPAWLSWVGALLFLLAYALYAEVLRENEYLSRMVEVQEGQHVVDTGLYGVVRHPMYAVTLLLFWSMPLVLGSLPALLILLCYLPIIVKRIRGEERLLEAELTGYRDYERRVRWRIIPFIW